MRKISVLLTVIVLTNLSVTLADQNLIDLVKKVKPCVVLIETFDKNNKPVGQGSGFFIDNKGGLITNYHVIEGAYSATIKTAAGKGYTVQDIVAKDIEADIVKLQVNVTNDNISFLNLNSKVPSEGEDIVVIGNPLGLESTISNGIVSAVREIPTFGKILQITAPISPGSSGSPVINSKGEVIGIATLVVTSGQNLNFAIPSDKIIALKETPQTPIFNAMTADSNDAQLFYQKGLKELWQENWSAALTYFQKAKEKKSDNANVWLAIGYCYDRLGHYKEAIEAFKQAIRIKPDYADSHYNLGLAYGKLGRYEDAVESYKQAIRIKPDLAEAHGGLGLAYHALGRMQEAIESYKRAIRIKPDDAEAYCGLGIIYGVLGQMQDAIKSFEQAIRINPDDALAYHSLGFTLLKLGRFEEAIESFEQAIRITPDYAEAHNNLGLAYFGLGRWQEAIESYKHAIKIKPDYAEAHCNLGASYVIEGDKGAALEEYKILKTLDTEQANKLFNFIYK